MSNNTLAKKRDGPIDSVLFMFLVGILVGQLLMAIMLKSKGVI